MKKISYFGVIVLSCFQLAAAEQSLESWGKVVNAHLEAIDAEAELKCSLANELYSWDPESSKLAEIIRTLIEDPLLSLCVGSQVLPFCCHAALSWAGFDSVNFGNYTYSAYQASSMALHLLSHLVAKPAIIGVSNEGNDNRYQISSFAHLCSFVIPVNAKILSGLTFETPALIMECTCNAFQVFHTGYLLDSREKQMNNETWLAYVLKILKIKYTAVGSTEKLDFINALLDKVRLKQD